MRRGGSTTVAKAALIRSGAGRSIAAASESTTWTRDEVDAFQAGVMRWRKDFVAISREVGRLLNINF